MYTSGCPKIQNRCCQSSGSPPPDGDEEVGAEEAVEHEQDERDRDDRERQQQQHLGDEAHPDEHRHAHQLHAGRAQVHDRDEEVDRRGQGRDAEDLETQQPEVDVHPGENCLEVRLA